MTAPMKDQTVLVIGRGSGVARAVTEAVREAGASVIAAGRDKDALAAGYDDPGITAEYVDLTDEGSIVALAERVGTVDHIVSTASARARGRVADLDRDAIRAPIRVNAIAPGVIDTGAWDALGDRGKADYFAGLSARNPARRIGTVEDIASAVRFALTNAFLTGQTLHVDGGEPLT